MKKSLLLHNPKAGEESHRKEHLLSSLKGAGHDTRYLSVKEKGWHLYKDSVDMLVVAGGDGTVRRVARALLSKKGKAYPPLGLLPLGTANNISKTVNEDEEIEGIIKKWEQGTTMPYDIGWIRGLPKKEFFIESMGMGVFPELIEAMKKPDKLYADQPEKRLEVALTKLTEIIAAYKAKAYRIIINGVDHSGEYLMVEVMNICSLGPNLDLAPDAHPGDGWFHVVMIAAQDRAALKDYAERKLTGEEPAVIFKTVKASSISIDTKKAFMHIDDKLVKPKGRLGLRIELDKGKLDFLK